MKDPEKIEEEAWGEAKKRKKKMKVSGKGVFLLSRESGKKKK